MLNYQNFINLTKMKKATELKLFIVLLFVIPIIFTQCKDKANKVVLQPGMPYYQVEDEKHPVDSTILRATNDGAVEVVYFNDGRVIPYYNSLNIRNLTLRELYLEHLKINGRLLTRLNAYTNLKNADYVSFNTYLSVYGLPTLTLKEFNTNIKGKDLRGPPGEFNYLLHLFAIFGLLSLIGLVYLAFVLITANFSKLPTPNTYDDS